MQPAYRITARLPDPEARCSRWRRACAFALAGCALAGAAAASDDPDEAFYQRASACAAAMQVDQFALVARARAGESVRPQLLELTKLGFAYVGEAYLKGLRDPRGSDMMKAATAQQKDWPAARHAALVTECRAEAQKVYDNAGLWRWPIDSKAAKRVDRFLSMPALPASAASR